MTWKSNCTLNIKSTVRQWSGGRWSRFHLVSVKIVTFSSLFPLFSLHCFLCENSLRINWEFVCQQDQADACLRKMFAFSMIGHSLDTTRWSRTDSEFSENVIFLFWHRYQITPMLVLISDENIAVFINLKSKRQRGLKIHFCQRQLLWSRTTTLNLCKNLKSVKQTD